MIQVQFRKYLIFFILFSLGSPLSGFADKVDVENQIEKPVQKAILLQQETRKSESEWQKEKAKQIALFESLEKESKTLEAQKAELIKSNAALDTCISAKARQLSDMEQISREILPYLDQVLARLKQLYLSDIPFLKEERQKRIEMLETLMPDPEITVSEKFRKIMEALTVETEYGRTIEVYQETVSLEGEPTLVNIFRLGRVNLFYQTLDRQQCGFYNAAETSWKPLEDMYLKDIQAAMDIGAKRKPVELLCLPVGRIVVK